MERRTAPEFLMVITCAVLFAGCASAMPSMELVDARQAYAHASAGPGSQLVPEDVQRAREALAVAEKAFQDDPGSYRTRDLAILAYRKAKLADTLAAKASLDLRPVRTETPKQR